MRLHVELEDGKAETVFVPAAAVRAAQNELGEGASGFDQAVFCAWWAFERNGWTDEKTWETFSEVAAVKVAETPDPKA